jgi:WD40 repeat protein
MKVLVNTETGKTWQIRQDGKYLYTANNGGKEKETAFVSADEATKKAEKDIWAKLKADFVFRDENAKIGNPSMLRYIKNGGYTGFMPVCADEKNDDFFILVNNDFETETLLKISENGTREEVKTFPVKGLTFFMQYLDGNIFMNTGHKIVFFDLSSGTVEKHSKMGESPTSVLDISGKRAVWYDEKKLTVFDFAVNKKIFEKEVKPEMYSGHTPQLSAAVYGDWLAFCSQSEKIVLLNIANGEEKIISKPTNALTYKMHFSADGKFLYTLEQYGRWSLAAYNTENLMQVWEEKDAKTVCFDNESKNFAVLKMYCNEIAVYDANTQKEALTFKGEYIVKNAFMAFTKNCLAVYSDYGCLGLYNLKK